MALGSVMAPHASSRIAGALIGVALIARRSLKENSAVA